MSMYKFKGEPETAQEKLFMQNRFAYIKGALTEEEQEMLSAKYQEYRDSEHEKGNEIYPSYIWQLERIKVSIREEDTP